MVFAHGIGGAQDLPIPAALAMAGAGAALAVSFIVLALAWRTPASTPRTDGRPLPARLAAVLDARRVRVGAAGARPALHGVRRVGGVAGPDLLVNPTFGVVYVLLWVGLVPASLLFGRSSGRSTRCAPCTCCSAGRTGGDPEQGVVDAAALGRLLAGRARPVRVRLAGAGLPAPDLPVAGPALVRGLRRGRARRRARCSAPGGSSGPTRSRCTPRWSASCPRSAARADGVLVVRSPLAQPRRRRRRCPAWSRWSSVLFGSTAFDSFKDSPSWLGFVQSSSVDAILLNFAALLVFCRRGRLTFTAATMATGVERGHPAAPTLPALFAHSVVPIVVGYVVAHYLSYFVEVGQQTLVQLSDPLGTGANYLGTADWRDQLLAITRTRRCSPGSRCSRSSPATCSASSRRTTGRSSCCRSGTSSPASCRCCS